MLEIIYVDEQKSQANAVVRAAVQSDYFNQAGVKSIEPLETTEETMDLIDELGCKALITDFRLSEFAPHVKFNGADLVTQFQERHEGFPCFVTTSFANDAADEDIDVNLVFPKSDALKAVGGEHQTLPFFLRVRKKITEYDNLVTSLTARHSELLAKLGASALTETEAEELVSLDGQLERMLRADSSLPDSVKVFAMKPMTDLISKTEELIADISRTMQQGGEGT